MTNRIEKKMTMSDDFKISNKEAVAANSQTRSETNLRI